jgi:hypothetical protein
MNLYYCKLNTTHDIIEHGIIEQLHKPISNAIIKKRGFLMHVKETYIVFDMEFNFNEQTFIYIDILNKLKTIIRHDKIEKLIS